MKKILFFAIAVIQENFYAFFSDKGFAKCPRTKQRFGTSSILHLQHDQLCATTTVVQMTLPVNAGAGRGSGP